MRLRPVMFGVLVGAAAIGYVVWHQYPFFRGLFLDLSPETAATLRPGMMIDEISAVVGGPPGDYWLRDSPDVRHFRTVSVYYSGGSVRAQFLPPGRVRWANQFAVISADCDPWNAASPGATVIRHTPMQPDFYYLYRDIAHALGVAIVVLVSWYTALGPLVRHVRSA